MEKRRRQFFRRFVSWILLIGILMETQTSFCSFAAEQKRADSKEYQVYLADYLVQYPPLRKDLGFDMLHRRLVREIKDQEGFLEGVKAYRFLTDTGSIVFQDKVQLYKQVILEILQTQLRTKEQIEHLEKSYQFWKNTILGNALQAMDFGPEVMDSESTLRTAIANADLSRVSDTFWKSTIFGEQMLFGEGASVSGQFSTETKAGISLCAGMVLNTTKNLLEYTEKMALYMAASEYRQGTLEFLELMYRQSSDPELLVALRTVIDSIRGLGSRDMAAAVVDLEYGFRFSTLTDILSSMIQQWCGAAGLLVSGTVILTELVFNSGQIGELALLLEAHVAVEDAVRAGLRYKLNSYHGGYESAIALNAGAMMLYDTYEYGLLLANSYAEAVLDQGFINQMGAKIAEGIGKGIYGPNYYPKDNSFSFKELSSSYKNMVKVNRTVFDSVWEMYLEDCPVKEAVKIVWEKKGIPVQGITMEEEPLRIVLESSVEVPWAVSARIQPANADNPRILYSSTDSTIVEIDETGYLTPHKEGVAYIEAVTEEGGYQARRQVIVTRGESSQISVSFDETKDYTDYYRKNKDGITLIKPIKGTNTMTRNGKTYVEESGIIPSYIQGQPVTEVDFAEWWHTMRQKHGSYINYVLGRRRIGGYWQIHEEVIFIGTGHVPFVIPDTVKRIAPECFAGNQFDAGIVFGKHLESIGEGAFRGTYFNENLDSGGGLSSITIPENVTELGKSVFEGAIFDGYQLVILGRSWERIPENFLKDSMDLTGVILECPNLKIIEKGAFGRTNGSCHLLDGKLPENLIEIGEGAFENAVFENGNGTIVFPQTLRKIGKSAFQGVRCKGMVLPEGIELIGEEAFAGGSMETVTCFGTEPDLAKGTMGSRAFSECENLLQIQIPMNIGTLGEDILQNSMRIERIEWPAGLSSIGKQTFRTLIDTNVIVCVRGENQGESHLLTDDWFHFRGGHHGEVETAKYYDENFNILYLEVPGAFAEQFNLGAFDGLADYYQYSQGGMLGSDFAHLDTLMICGTVKEIIPGTYAKSFEDFVGNAVYARNEEGDIICLYQREETSGDYYKKYSRGFYENWEDYQIVFPAETEAVTQQSFENSSVSVRINADAKTVGRMENRPVEIYLWQNEEGENRGKALGEFLEFEDLYLKQPRYFYFKIGVNDGEQLLTSYPGEYQISFQIGKDWEEEKTAAYHIDEDGLITRLSGQVCGSGSNREYKVLTKDLGSFAVVHLTSLFTEMRGSFSEELHQLLISDVVEKTDGEEGEAKNEGKGEIEKQNTEKSGKKPSDPVWLTNVKNWLQEKKEEIAKLWKPKKDGLEPDEEEKKMEPEEKETEEKEQEEKSSSPVWLANMKNWLREKKEGISAFRKAKKEKPDPEKEGKGKELEGQETATEDQKEKNRIEEEQKKENRIEEDQKEENQIEEEQKKEDQIEKKQKKEAETKEGSLWFIFAGIGIFILIGMGVSRLSKKKKRSNRKRNGRPHARK